MAKKRALVDGVLNVGNLSARFTQDVEDMNLEPEQPVGKNLEGLGVTDKVKSSWGIGKTYAIKDALKERRNVCFVSLFGMKDVQQIFHETFYQLGLKDKNGIQKIISRLIDVIAVFSKKVGVAKGILESIIKEKELFFELTKTFQELHIIVIDGL